MQLAARAAVALLHPAGRFCLPSLSLKQVVNFFADRSACIALSNVVSFVEALSVYLACESARLLPLHLASRIDLIALFEDYSRSDNCRMACMLKGRKEEEGVG